MDTKESDTTEISDMVSSAISDIIRDPTPHEESRFFSKLKVFKPAFYNNSNDFPEIQYTPQELHYKPSNLYYSKDSPKLYSTKVVTANNLDLSTTETDISEGLDQFGVVANVVKKYKHAYIEFENKEAAEKCVSTSRNNNGVFIKDKPILFDFSGKDSLEQQQSPPVVDTYGNFYQEQKMQKVVAYNNDLG